MDELALLESPFAHEEKIDAIIAGLPKEYKLVIDQIECKDTPPTIPYIHECLGNHEEKLPSMNTATMLSPFTASENAVQYNNKSSVNNQSSRSNNKNICNNNNYMDSKTTSGNIQIGLTTIPPNLTWESATSWVTVPNDVRNFSRSKPPQVTLLLVPNPWILDSGATHHLTSDLNNIALHQPYNGGDDVMIADGEGSQYGGSVAPTEN
ncbi:PREDICTED: uncharacterized protein LOC104779272 [Camelina sativa]|uniref:Uncharacterized protein LOC104779272 n=1 Tax=Camelina sativa TaxID=90675 RepID=A0ABM0YJH2_CAMSA|nr:PREDICTED: uncharacterized protein LOC104779272 [Camelina sativa]